MLGLKRRRDLLPGKSISESYSGNDKNTLKSRIMSMDKGWIGKKKEIKEMNRTTKEKNRKNVVPMSGITRV